MGLFSRDRVTVPVDVTVTAQVRQEKPATKAKAKPLRERTTVEAFPPPSENPPAEVEPHKVNAVEVKMKTGKREKFEASAVEVGAAGELVIRRLQTVYLRCWEDTNLWSRGRARLKRTSGYSLRAYASTTTFTDAEFEAFPVEWCSARVSCEYGTNKSIETTFEHVIAPGEWKSYGVFHEAEGG